VYVELGLEFLCSTDRARKSQDLATTDLFTLDTTEESTHVVTSLSLTRNVREVQQIPHRTLTRSSSLWNISAEIVSYFKEPLQ